MGLKGSPIMLAVVLLLSLTMAGWIFFRFARGSSIAGVAPTINPSQDAAASLDDKDDKPTNSIRPVQIPTDSAVVSAEITEAQATSRVNEAVRSGEFPLDVTNLRIRFQDERILASGNVNVSGFGVPVEARARIDAVAGEAEVTVEAIDFGGIGVPGVVRQQISDAIAGGVDQAIPKDSSLVVDNVTVANGVMTIEGHRAIE